MSVASVAARPSRPISVRLSTTALLVLGLVAATGWTVLSGGWSEATGSAVLVGVLGAAEAVGLARAGLGRGLLVLASPFLLFATLVPTTIGSRPAAPAGFDHLLGQYVGAAGSGLLGNAGWEFNVSLSALLWLCGAWTGWLAVRERRAALASAPAWSVLAVTVINAPDQGGVSLPATVTAVTAILVIAAVHLNRLNEGWERRRVAVLPGTDGRFATAAAAGGVIAVLLALALPPLTSTDLSGRIFGFGGSQGGQGGGGSGNGGTGGGSGGSGTVRFGPATVPGGPLTLTDSPVLTYTSSTQAGVYLQMATDGVFDGGNWLPDESALNNGAFAEELVAPGQIPRDRALTDGGIGAQRQEVSATLSITDDASGTNVLPFPGEPDATSVQVRARGLSQTGAGADLLTVDSVSTTGQVTTGKIVVTATQSVATVGQLRAAGTDYPAFLAADDFLQLNDDISGGASVIHAIAEQWTAQASNPYDQAVAIETHLRDPNAFHYTLSPPLPPRGSAVWPVTYFLTTSHAGYCQYFATAMGAMLRSLGIPSRLINGYGPGTSPNSAGHGVDSETVFTVSSNDAHTWVQAYFPGYGWIPFEPTPPSQAGGDYEPFTRGGAAPAGTAPTGSASAAPTPAPSRVPVPGAGDASGGGPSIVALRVAAALVVVALALSVVAGWFWRPRGVAGVWRRIRLLGTVAGVPPDPALTFDEYAARIAAALRAGPATAAALADIAALSGRAVYSRDGLRGDDAGRMAAAWRSMARRLPGVGWRALRRRRAIP